MTPHYVVSSTIDAIGHMDDVLYVRFKSGSAYSYDEVPYSLYDGLKKAESCGRFLHLRIKKGGFHYKRLDTDPFKPAQVSKVATVTVGM